MSAKVKVKFYKAGRWAEHIVSAPQIQIENDGDIHEVSIELAMLVTTLEPPRGEIVKDDPEPKIEEAKPQTKERGRRTGRRPKAEDDIDPLG